MNLPKIYKAVVCVATDSVLAAIISSYFQSENEYFVILPFETIKHTPGDIVAQISLEYAIANVKNRIIQLEPELIILAGLNEFQTNSLGLPSKIICEINNQLNIVDNIPSQYFTDLPELKCPSKDILRGLYIAKLLKSHISIDENAVLPDFQDVLSKGFIGIENKFDISSVCAVNLAISLQSRIEILPLKSKDEVYDLKTRLETDDASEDLIIQCEKEIAQQIEDINIKQYEWATFLTYGFPYSIILNDSIRTSLIYRASAPFSIFDTIYKEENKMALSSALLFSVPIDEANIEQDKSIDESPHIAKLLEKNNFYITLLANKHATKKKFNDFVSQFPYEILHIASHGGGADGYYRLVTLTDKLGQSHKFDHYEIADFELVDELDEKGQNKVAVVVMTIPISLDGMPWGSEILSEKSSNEAITAVTEYLTGLNSAAKKNSITIPHNSHIPYSRFIKCIDNIHQGQFHYLAGQTNPFVFNNSCCSWYDMGISFLNIGAYAYIGTISSIANKIAIEASKLFYKLVIEQGLDLMTACQQMNLSIENKKYRNIYIYWGLPYTFLKGSNEPSAMVAKNLVDLLQSRFNIHQKKILDPNYDPSLRKNCEVVMKFINEQVILVPTIFWKRIEDKLSSNGKITRHLVKK